MQIYVQAYHIASNMDQKLFILATVILFMSMQTTSLSKKEKPMSFRATIMHRNARGSPLHNPDASEDQIREKDLDIGKQRAKYVNKIISSIKAEIGIQADIGVTLESSFIMKFKIGSPAVETFGYLDTGSGLSWVQCTNCTKKCSQQNVELYDMKSSSSLRFVGINDSICSQASGSGATMSNYRGKCYYKLEYDGKFISAGVLSTEKFGFNDGFEIDHVVFGCSTANERRDTNPPALIGLGNLSSSFVRQLSFTSFKYELKYGDLISDIVGIIEFGARPEREPKNPIPMIPGSQFYRLSVESIMVNERPLIIPDSIFQNGIILDTGSTFTLLSHEPYDKLRSAVIQVLGNPVSSGSGETCYKEFNAATAPNVTFQFKNYTFNICQYNLWYKNSGFYCLAIKESPDYIGGKSVLGMYQQRGMNVEFNLVREFVNMEYIDSDCHVFY